MSGLNRGNPEGLARERAGEITGGSEALPGFEWTKAEEALRETPNTLRAVLDAVPAGVVLADRQGRILITSSATEQILGGPVTGDAHEAEGGYELCMPDGAPVRRGQLPLSLALAGQAVSNREILVKRPGGFQASILAGATPLRNEQGEIWGAVAVFQDISERKRAEEAIGETEESFRTFIRESPDGIIILDNRGCIVEWNDGEENITGLTRSEVIGLPLWEVQYRLAPPEKRTPAFMATAREKISRGLQEEVQLRRVLEDEIQRLDGARRIVQSVLFAIRKGQSILACAICRDITERKRAEETLCRAQEQLRNHADNLEKTVQERTAKLHELVEELEHLSYSITHNMRAPLRAMRSFAEAIAEICSGSANPRLNDFVGRIMTAADRMDQLITDALCYTKAVRQEVPLVPVDIAALLRGLLDTYPEFMPEHAQIRLDAPIPPVQGNEASLIQCFSNLLSNAVKFVAADRKTQVRIWAERIYCSTSDHPASSGCVRIWVEDNGIGISESMMPKVFDMFSRASTAYEGTGIGLALVRKVVHRMGGRVGVESREGQGSRFWVELQEAELEPGSSSPLDQKSSPVHP